MKTNSKKLLVLFLIGALPPARGVAQEQAELRIDTFAGLTITGAVGKIYTIEYVGDLALTNDSRAWRALEFLQLPASPYLWIDKSTSAREARFYRAVGAVAPTGTAFIPPGAFRMGSRKNEVDRMTEEGPQTAVTISRGFWMGKYEVTQGEYEALIGSNPSYFNGVKNGVNYGTYSSRPVEQVTWNEARAYCAALTARERAAGRIAANSVYRLPTEAEWEYACRAWTSTRFSYGDDPGYTNLVLHAWHGDYTILNGVSHPVGQKVPNLWGLHDMHGNVFEWCQDWYGEYSGGIAIDPQGPPDGTSRVVRGGYMPSPWDYSHGPQDYRSAARSELVPAWRDSFIGFRVVLAASEH